MANPYDNLPKRKATSDAGSVSAPELITNKKRGTSGGLPEGWKRVPSRSKPGKFSYENQYTKERVSWVPDRPAERVRGKLPPEPPRAPKPRRPSDPEEAQRQNVEKLKLGLMKIKTHLGAEDKFGPACKLLHKSLFSSVALSPDTSDIYYDVLEATQAVPERCIKEANRRYLKHVFKVVQEKRDLFPRKWHYRLDTWILRSVSHNELFTDDTYQFNRSAKAFTDAIVDVELRGKKRIVEQAGTEADAALRELETVPEEHVQERKRVIVEVLATLQQQAKLPWAISTCNLVFKQVTDRRHIFDPPEQEIIDTCNDARLGKLKHTRKEDHTGTLQGRVLARQSKF